MPSNQSTPNAQVIPVWGLTKPECDAVNTQASELMLRGWVTGISIHNERQYMCVFDCLGEPYFIGREEGVCFLCDSNNMILTSNQHLSAVLRTMEETLRK